MLLNNKVAIITGASRGIGKSIAFALVKEGASIVINGTNIDLLKNVTKDIESIGGKCIFVCGDISNVQTSKKLVEAALKYFKDINILVNNAGRIVRSRSKNITLKEWNRTLQINLTGTMLMCLETLKYMKNKKQGKIVNISSSAAKSIHPNALPSYGASKAGILYLTRHLASEVGSYGIHVNAVCPGPIKTDMTDQWSKEYRDKRIANIPLGRIGEPEEVAQTVLFLVSSMSDFITGEAINVNGGLIMD